MRIDQSYQPVRVFSNPDLAFFPTVMFQGGILFLHDSRFQSQISRSVARHSLPHNLEIPMALAYFRSVSRTFHSKFFSTSFCFAPSQASMALFHTTRSAQNGFLSHKFVAHGAWSRINTRHSGPSSRQTLTYSGQTYCNSAPGLFHSMSTFGSADVT